MGTTLDLPEDLLNEAMKAAHVNTKTKAIIIALEELFRRSKISEQKQHKRGFMRPLPQRKDTLR
jgi:hypothetical protein